MSTQILKLHPRDNSNTLSHSKLVQSLYIHTLKLWLEIEGL